MADERAAPAEESLDPESWDALRALGHRMVDDMLEYLRTVRERPVWRPVPAEVKARFRVPAPRALAPAEAVYGEFLESVLPYPMGNIHPRFWGWVIGTGTPTGALAEFLAATMNPNAGGADHVATYVEEQVLDWCKEIVGFPAGASGLLVSGGSMANLVGLAVARQARAGYDVRRHGVAAAPGALTLYASSEVHSSVAKAAELMGLGTDGLRLAPVNDAYEIDVAALARMVADDRAAGRVPFCVVGNAGTVNTGAFDDLPALADLCRREELWLHVDGAFGALAALAPEAVAPELRPRLAAIAHADSVAYDLHKWMYVPYDAGVALVRDAEAHHATFTSTPGYLARASGGLAAGVRWFSDYGFELSRGFRALKVWVSFKEHGLDRYGRLVAQNIAQARHLETLVRTAPELELMAPVPLNIVCFRWIGGGREARDLDALNRELLVRVHESGVAVPSSVTLGGRAGLRVAITNHRSRREDFDLLVETVRRLGAELASGG